MSRKTEQLQIRLTPEQKASLNRLAQRSGQGISAYVLSRVLPQAQVRFLELLRVLRDDGQKRFALAELNDLLSSLGSSEFLDTVSKAPLGGLSPYLRNYVAAMIEQAATQKRIPPPGWLQEVVPLQAPHFVTSLHSLRLHLLRAAPVPFRRRNIFVDSALGRRI